MDNSVMCTKCGQWIHGRCTKMKRVTSYLARQFVCKKCEAAAEESEESAEELCEEVKMVDGFCYLGDRLNASGGSEAAVTARTRYGWLKFKECGELLLGRKMSLKLKGKVYRSCVRSAMLYGSETWCLRENEMAILRRTERAMVRAMCGVKLMDKKNTEELMCMLGIEETLDRLARANGVRWFGHVLRRPKEDILWRALEYEVEGKRKRGRPKGTWRRQVENDTRKIGLTMEDAVNRTRWREGVRAIAENMGYIRPPPKLGRPPD